MERIRKDIDDFIRVRNINLNPPVEKGMEDEVGEPMVTLGSTTFRPIDSSQSSDASFPGFSPDPTPSPKPTPGTSGTKRVGLHHTMHSVPPKDKRMKRPNKLSNPKPKKAPKPSSSDEGTHRIPTPEPGAKHQEESNSAPKPPPVSYTHLTLPTKA